MKYVKSLLLTLPLATSLYSQSPEQKLHSASEVVIKEQVISWGKAYNVYVDDERVATVNGKNVVWWADNFTLKTIDNKVLASEHEHKRILSYNRAASVYNKNSQPDGFICEQYWEDFFNWNHLFHIFDASQKEIGKTETTTFSVLDKIDVYDAQGNTDYQINENINLVTDEYSIRVFDRNSPISIEKVILLACIEDAIKDAAKEKSSDD